MNGEYIGAFLITFLLTRLTNIIFLRKLQQTKTAFISFFLISTLSLVLSSQTMGFQVGLKTYIPWLVMILLFDIYKPISMSNKITSLFPKRKQWKNWSLPSKLTAIGTLAGVLSFSAYLIEKTYALKQFLNDKEESSNYYEKKSDVLFTENTDLSKCKGEYLFRWNAPAFIGKKRDYFDKDLKRNFDIFEIITVDGLGLIIDKKIKLLAIGSEALSAYGGSNGNHIEKTIGFGGGNWRIIIENIEGSNKNPISPFKIGDKYKPYNPINSISFNPGKTIPACPKTTSGIN